MWGSIFRRFFFMFFLYHGVENVGLRTILGSELGCGCGGAQYALYRNNSNKRLTPEKQFSNIKIS